MFGARNNNTSSPSTGNLDSQQQGGGGKKPELQKLFRAVDELNSFYLQHHEINNIGEIDTLHDFREFEQTNYVYTRRSATQKENALSELRRGQTQSFQQRVKSLRTDLEGPSNANAGPNSKVRKTDYFAEMQAAGLFVGEEYFPEELAHFTEINKERKSIFIDFILILQ